MYKHASENRQRQLRQLWLHDLQGSEFAELPTEQQRENLVAKMKGIEAELLSTGKGPKRDELGRIKLELQQMISALRPKRKGPPGVPGFFVEVARESLPKLQFQRMMDEAANRARIAESNAEQAA